MKQFLFYLLFSVIITVAYTQNGQIRGKVLNDKGDPMVGATVVIMEPEIIGAYTDEEGIFDLSKIAVGTYEVMATFFGYDTAYQKVEVAPGKIYTLRFVLHESNVYSDEVEITDKKVGKIEKTEIKTAVTEITPEQIKLIPSIGAPDLAQYIQVLPGVVFTGDQGGQLYIRGGTPIQNLVFLDGMIVYSPFHSLGLFSVFDVDYIRSTDVYTAAFPGKYGGRLSSVMDIKTRNGNLKGFHAKANINPFNAGAIVEGPLAKGKREGAGLSYLVSAKNNYINMTSPILYPYIKNNADTATKGLPYNFLDMYGKLSASDGVNYANVFGFSHNDNVNYQFPASVRWNSFGGGANFQLLPQGAAAIISGNFGFSSYRTGLNTASETFPRNSGINGFNGGLNMTYILNTINRLDVGLTLLGFNTDYTFTNSYGFITSQRNSNTEAAIFASYKHVFLSKNSAYSTRIDSSFERLVIEPSIRLHYFNDQAYFSPEPRLRGKLNFNRLSFSFGTGLYAQNLLSAQSDRDVVNIFQGFLSAPERGTLFGGTKENSLQHGFHFLGGVEVEAVKNVKTTVEGWYKGFTQLSNINRDKVFPEDPNFIAETGKAYGADFILQYQTPTTYIYATYGWAKVTRTDSKRTYAPVFDRRHNANLVLAYKLGHFEMVNDNGRIMKSRFTESKWEASARFALGSGFPFTQTQGFIEKIDFLDNGAQSNYQTQNGQLGLILASDINAGRLPYYHRVDFSVKKRWVFGNKMLLEASANIINAYNRQNIFYFDRIRYIPVYQLPIIPSLGISFTY
ncbi:MAG: TonB-dependent receptor [Bacteroidia bacterium]|nr:TonB-dependent receptor [Bacteroidia bacterium]